MIHILPYHPPSPLTLLPPAAAQHSPYPHPLLPPLPAHLDEHHRLLLLHLHQVAAAAPPAIQHTAQSLLGLLGLQDILGLGETL